MIVKPGTVTVALMVVGLFTSFGYTAVALQQTPTQPGVQPTPMQPGVQPTPMQPGVQPTPMQPGVQPTPMQPGVQPTPMQPEVQPTPTQPGVQPTPMQSPPENQPSIRQSPNRVSSADKQFMIKAAQAGIAEVTLGQLAADRAVSTDVKNYGQQMVAQHTQANNQLIQIAAQKGVTLPTTTDAQHKAVRAKLGQIPGRRFDRTYIADMVKDHAKVLTLFQREVAQGRDEDVKAFAAKLVPTIQEHLNMARQLASANTARRS